MDSKKSILILGLLAMVLLISSEVSARDLTETSTNAKDGELEVVEKSNEVNDAKYGGGYHNGGGGYHNGGGGYNNGGGYHNGGGG
ncbi:hypothetical protein, partial [Klebsiella pneumoniae]|uniref:hypothetical protein n=1 Tax=Klebsiella pneumoniae TaxID=573 RepID=UPI0015E0197B